MATATSPAMTTPASGPAESGAAPGTPPTPVRMTTRRGGWLDKVPASRRLTAFWMNFFFFCANKAPWFVRGSEWFWIGMSHACFRRALRAGPRANARHLLGPDTSARDLRRFETEVLRQFYRFIEDVGWAKDKSPRQILDRISEVHGEENYCAARAAGRGAIIATAHVGSFEVGMAALSDREKRVHVVFQQDVFDAFDGIRDRLHRKLGVVDARAERGLNVWLSLREALRDDDVVLIQADRVMPGQRGVAVPFFDGHIELPVGPVKLAALSGAPIIPVFAVRRPDRTTRLIIEPAIEVGPGEPVIGRGQAPPSLLKFAAALERLVRAHADQWLMLHRVWLEDQGSE